MTGLDLPEVLALEVETDPPPGTLINLVENPSGNLGGYGWVTPVPGSVLVGETSEATEDRQGLRYTTGDDAGGNYFRSEPLPVAAGQYVAASWYVNETPAAAGSNTHRVRLEWLDSNRNEISTTGWTTFTVKFARCSFGRVLAPASTSYVRIRFEPASVSHAYPLTVGGWTFSVREVVVAKASTPAPLETVTRTNLAVNPSFETNTTGWLPYGCTLTRDTTQYHNTLTPSFASLRVNTTGATQGPYADPVSNAVGSTYTFSAWVRGTGSFLLAVYAVPTYAYIGGSSQVTLSSTWQRVSVTATIPPGNTGIYPLLAQMSAGAQTMYVDEVLIEQSPTLGTYFDGATPAANDATHAWTGTANNSTSVAKVPHLPGESPIHWTDILGPTHEIKVNREDLNLGTLTATVLDSSLDPAVAETLRPGRRVRLSALSVETGTFEPIFTGTTTHADVTYDLKRLDADNPKHARISLTATDNVQRLANSQRSEGVKYIGDLPAVLEGCGVPWTVNGSGNHVDTATIVARNESATAIDQIAITRDSNHGYAWVDRNNVLQAWSVLPAPGINAIENGTFEVDTSGWTALNAISEITRAAFPSPGNYVARLRLTSPTSSILGMRCSVAAAASVEHVLSCQVRADPAGTGRPVSIWVDWYGEDGALIASSTPIVSADVVGSWTTISGTVLAPPGATVGTVWIWLTSVPVNESHYVDNVSLVTATTPAHLAEDDYSNLDVSFNVDDCINTVSVRLLRFNLATGETVEVPYGPYVDQASVDEWGTHSAEFTVQGLTDTSVAMHAFAEEVFEANATPRVRVNSLTIPIRHQADLVAAKAFLDLYTLVQVSHDDKAISDRLRVTGIEHTITSNHEGGKWLVVVKFGEVGSVAAPQVTPPVTTSKAYITEDAGVAIVSITNNQAGFIDVVFHGTFANPPSIVATPANSNYLAATRLKTTTGFRLDARHYQATAATAQVPVEWQARAYPQ